MEEGREIALHFEGLTSSENRGPSSLPSLKGESQAISAQLTVGRRPRKVRVCVVGCSLMGWVEAAKAWGAEVEAIVVHTPDILKDIRRKFSLTPTTTPQDALLLLPLGPWNGCLYANIAPMRLNLFQSCSSDGAQPLPLS